MKIMIIPDFDISAEAGEMLSLKEAIETDKDFSVKIVDFRQEIQSEGLKDSQIIEACARRLEQLATDKTLRWDNHQDYCTEDPVHDCIRLFEEDSDNGFNEEEKFDIASEEEQMSKAELFKKATRRLKITKSHSNFDLDQAAPDLMVVFGKSVMLAEKIRDKKILFINPEYESEWPWKKLYYNNRDAAGEYMYRLWEESRKPIDTYVFEGIEVNRSNRPITRFAFQTDGEYIDEFDDRYPWLSMRDASMGNNPHKLAEAIRDFAEGNMEFPLLDIFDMWRDSLDRNPAKSRMLSLHETLKLGRVSITGLRNGVPMGNGQSGLKILTTERSYPTPVEAVSDRHELTLLRDAVKAAVDALPPKKRILIVPDYFVPYNAPYIIELREQMRRKGYYVTVVAAGDTLKKTRIGIERRCKKNPFDLIVTIEGGCLLAARITNTPRIFVNPDWNDWEWMKIHLGNEKELVETRGINNSGPFYTYRLNADEVIEARKMGERSYIRKDGKLAVGWFTHDAIDTHLPEEHMKRFNSAAYPPIIDLSTEDGIASLAKEIDKFIKSYAD